MLDVIKDTVIDSLKLLPFLFLTFLLMEYFEHKMKNKSKKIVEKAGKFGFQPLKSFYTYNVIIQNPFFLCDCLTLFCFPFVALLYHCIYTFLIHKTHNIIKDFMYTFYILFFIYLSSFPIASKADKMLSISSRRTWSGRRPSWSTI